MARSPSFQGLIRFLRKHHPPVYPVRVYRRCLKKADHLGCCELSHRGTKHFNITIHDTDDIVMVHLLIHEWAHAVAWLEGHAGVADHGPEWALAMSRIYRDVLED